MGNHFLILVAERPFSISAKIAALRDSKRFENLNSSIRVRISDGTMMWRNVFFVSVTLRVYIILCVLTILWYVRYKQYQRCGALG
jgi:hypothetical protein